MLHSLQTLALVSSMPLWLLPICTQAHMQMSWPYPLRSPLDPAVPETVKDYNMIAPLFYDGSNFPCKYYQTQDDSTYNSYVTKATYNAGGTYNLTLAGTATHLGGSCQISLSYDNGASFKVIKSIIGGCPLGMTYNFTIPSYAPSSGSALLSWSWFNLVGNREMYQNCARVQIQSAPMRRYERKISTRQTTLNSLPDMFACNIGNGCKTIERREVVFPNPGNDVEFGQDAITPDSGPGFNLTTMPTGNAFSNGTTGPGVFVPGTSSGSTTSMPSVTDAPFPFPNATAFVGPTGTGTGTGFVTGTGLPTGSTSQQIGFALTVSPTLATATTPSTTTTISNMQISSSNITSTTSTMANTSIPSTTMTSLPILNNLTTLTRSTTTSSSSSTPSSTLLSGPCTPGSFACNSNTTFSQCVTNASGSTSYTYMGSVAAGMQCVNGAFTRANDGPCTPSGSIFCKGTAAFYMCDQGGLIYMGPVAAGTACRNGVIGFA